MKSREDILGAVARGWCHPKNEHKVMDSDLAFAIADEVTLLLNSHKRPADEDRAGGRNTMTRFADGDLSV